MSDRVREALEAALEALTWASGSQDFAPGGQARVGWEKLAQPAIDKGFAALAAQRDAGAGTTPDGLPPSKGWWAQVQEARDERSAARDGERGETLTCDNCGARGSWPVEQDARMDPETGHVETRTRCNDCAGGDRDGLDQAP